MNKLVSLRTCAKLLGIHPVQLSRWVKTYPSKIKVHNIFRHNKSKIGKENENSSSYF